MNLSKSVDFILSHFEEPLFPRKLKTSTSNGEFQVYTKQEVIESCEIANSKDCWINAYPECIDRTKMWDHTPNLIFIDLDLSLFLKYRSPKRILNRTLNNTLQKITKFFNNKHLDFIIDTPNGVSKMVQPTVLWTGNGYHIYLPVMPAPLNQNESIYKDKFPNLFSEYGKYNGLSVAEAFLKFVQLFFTSNQIRTEKNITFNSYFVPIPNTLNANYLSRGLRYEDSVINIIAEWNGYRPPLKVLAKDFDKWVDQEEVNQKRKNRRKALLKDSINVVPISHTNIDWIEKVLKMPLKDHRQYCLFRIFVPYLLNIKQLPESAVYRILLNWINLCNKEKQINFDAKTKIENILKNIKDHRPISTSKLKYENNSLYLMLEFNNVFAKV